MMLAVASPPPTLPLDHDKHIETPTSPVVQPQQTSVFFGPQEKPLRTIEDLLKNPIEFKQGCLTPSAGVLTAGISEHKYKPINDEPMSEDEEDQPPTDEKPLDSTPSKSTQTAERLFSGSLDMDWPTQTPRHPGFNNMGNTCFLNSVLQCLLHTPPLLNILRGHQHDKTGFCMICLLRELAQASFFNKKRGTGMVLTHLAKIAKGMRQGRQEDAHEFLRYSVDALQRSALAIHSSSSSKHPNPNKIPHGLAETSWVHAIFGGRLRSRVSCRTCHHCSDTFDSLLDLSVEINRSSSLMNALTQFVKPEILSGEDAYRCEKCKKPVTAEKFMTVHEAPVCLTIHLKRFSPTGRKIVNQITYPEVLDLQKFMSEGQTGKKYILNGVINHLGPNPNSGHYTAHVRGANGRWTNMDDEVVTSCIGPPLNHKNAYVLFYIQTDKAHPTQANDDDDVFSSLGGQKRSRDDMESNGSRLGPKPSRIQVKTSTWGDLFQPSKKSRIEDNGKAKQGVAGSSRPAPIGVASVLGGSLVNYVGSDDIEDVEDEGQVVDSNPTNKSTPVASPTQRTAATDPPPNATSTTPSKPTPQFKNTPFSTPNPKAALIFSPIKPSSFYGNTQKKDKRFERTPFSGLSGPGSLHAKRDSGTSDIQKQMDASMGFHQFGGHKQQRAKERMRGKKSL
ncbi:ubiquitin specific peptidase 36 [Rhizoctonia solani]|uniref:Ubiquitin carboxyl-terminal hydrolase n=1 Tax=Rhizoctonia solani TaxID=456999 RepID=A0A0K6FTA1_9AGAM|nr:ubiquitin specific peptidase 36 [Rhizoctonia solani]